MATLAGPFIVTAALLAAGGAAKVVRPAPTARALGEMGVPASSIAVRIGAAAELAIAAGALAGGGRPFALLVAASFLGFAVFVAAALRRDVPLSSCGCFGVQDTPPTAVHLVLNLAAAVAAGAVALGVSGGGGLTEVTAIDGSPLLRGAFVVLTATSVWLAYTALTLLPKLQGASR
ncbi:MAG: MauE/DoxX family redox-associated membrane protein [Acidimicrobiales bacterium]